MSRPVLYVLWLMLVLLLADLAVTVAQDGVAYSVGAWVQAAGAVVLLLGLLSQTRRVLHGK